MTINGKITIKDALSYGTKMLSETGNIDVPLLECEILLGYILNIERIKLYLDRDRLLNDSEKEAFLSVLKRRIEYEPVSYITNNKEFMSLSFYVEKGVLIPRPETETLVELILNELKGKKDMSILDICTGSGSIAVSLAYYLKDSKLTAIDKYDVCIKAAKINAEKYNLTDRIEFVKADILNDTITDEKFDCIVSNPPYIKK
ncbi:MAG: peptide chain release factor N(5)-glutamine methyltransferase, partial [Clostridia bacterium]|nr:peptide chain release factor N(5)-glutamine methyltransferase [Clostridia bacterium]